MFLEVGYTKDFQFKIYDGFPNPSFADARLIEPNGTYFHHRENVGWLCCYQVQLINNASQGIILEKLKIAGFYESSKGSKKLLSNTLIQEGSIHPPLPVLIRAGERLQLEVMVKRVAPNPEANGFSPYFRMSYVPESDLDFHQYGGFIGA